jgi:hypothetical protein
MRVVKHAETEAKTEARLVKRDCGPGVRSTTHSTDEAHPQS